MPSRSARRFAVTCRTCSMRCFSTCCRRSSMRPLPWRSCAESAVPGIVEQGNKAGRLRQPNAHLDQREPLIEVIEAYKAFDQRQPGWIKVVLIPKGTVQARAAE